MIVPDVTITINPPELPLPELTAQQLGAAIADWTLTVPLRMRLEPSNILWAATELENDRMPLHWRTVETPEPPLLDFSERPFYRWSSQPRILALIPHRHCEAWLPRCLASLVDQSYPLTNIVVIDDASTEPPLSIVAKLPQVTLLQASAQVGPYRLIQTVINQTNYDAYLFQDADDWSVADRLETLLRLARKTGAELVGSQELRIVEPEQIIQAIGYPADVNRALMHSPGHPLLHPTSLVTRDLVQRIGGFATSLRFGGDTEFLLRAHWVARIVNSSRYCYFRRKRPNSLTTAIATGLDSPIRQALIQQIKQRAIVNQTRNATGEPLDLTPLVPDGMGSTDPPDFRLNYCCGPRLNGMTEYADI
jgi:hypothetical protein